MKKEIRRIVYILIMIIDISLYSLTPQVINPTVGRPTAGKSQSGKGLSLQNASLMESNGLNITSFESNGSNTTIVKDPITHKLIGKQIVSSDGHQQVDHVSNKTMYAEFDSTGKEVYRELVPGDLDLNQKIIRQRSINSSHLSFDEFIDVPTPVIENPFEGMVSPTHTYFLDDVTFKKMQEELSQKQTQTPAQFIQLQPIEKNIESNQPITDAVEPIHQKKEDLVKVLKKIKNRRTGDEFVDYSDGSHRVNYKDGSIEIDYQNGDRFNYRLDGQIEVYSSTNKATRKINAKGYEGKVRKITSKEEIVELINQIKKDIDHLDAPLDEQTKEILINKSTTWFPLFDFSKFRSWVADFFEMLRKNSQRKKIVDNTSKKEPRGPEQLIAQKRFFVPSDTLTSEQKAQKEEKRNDDNNRLRIEKINKDIDMFNKQIADKVSQLKTVDDLLKIEQAKKSQDRTLINHYEQQIIDFNKEFAVFQNKIEKLRSQKNKIIGDKFYTTEELKSIQVAPRVQSKLLETQVTAAA